MSSEPVNLFYDCLDLILYSVIITAWFLFIANKKISMKQLNRCRETLHFPWTTGPSPGDLTDKVMVALELWQRLKRNREELEILHTEKENLIQYVVNHAKKSGDDRSWLTDALITGCESLYSVHGEHIDMFQSEPALESDDDEGEPVPD